VRPAAGLGQGGRVPMKRDDVRNFDDARWWAPGRASVGAGLGFGFMV
jgi:hypothetical protein